MSNTVQLIGHDPVWAQVFDAEAARLRACLGPLVAAIHHIGSTAIVGVLAKPVIDILLETGSLSAFDESSSALEALGYDALGEHGIAGRRYFRRRGDGGETPVHLHAYVSGSSDVERHVRFRDYLRTHPGAATDYSTLKRQLATIHPNDRQAYQRGKSAFIEATERAAIAWARDEPYDETRLRV